MVTLFERLGGKEAVEQTVETFYQKVLADERVNPFFENANARKIIAMQKSFIGMLTGGPMVYTGKGLRHAHKHLVEKGLNDEHFDIVAQHLKDTLTELNVPEAEINEFMALVEPLRDDVLNK